MTVCNTEMFTLQKTPMSSSTTTFSIPLFTGANWQQWWPSMLAYMQATGCTWVIDFTQPATITAMSTKDNQDFYIQWTKANDTLVGLIWLCLSDSLKQETLKHQAASDLLKALKNDYAASGISGASTPFKELLDTRIASSSYPTPSLNKVKNLFTRLNSMGYKFPANIQVMLLLTKLPESMNVIAQMIVQAKDSITVSVTLQNRLPNMPSSIPKDFRTLQSWIQHLLSALVVLKANNLNTPSTLQLCMLNVPLS